MEQRGVEVNQRDAGRGWTPLMRCARVAHYRHAPYLQVLACVCLRVPPTALVAPLSFMQRVKV